MSHPVRAPSGPRQATPDGGSLDLLRSAALVAVVAGAAGSVGLMLRASGDTLLSLRVIFVGWILSPFAALAWATVKSRRWPALTRTTLYGVSLAITLGALAFYGGLVAPPAGSPRAFVYVMTPLASWGLGTIVVSIAALSSRRR